MVLMDADGGRNDAFMKFLSRFNFAKKLETQPPGGELTNEFDARHPRKEKCP
jgi:hypothetical protein